MSDKFSSSSGTILPAKRCSESALGMKDQYFGDRNDYFKYDLTIFLCEQLAEIRRLTFIPMLTRNDNSGDGDLINYRQGAGRADLYKFLKDKLKKRQRKVSHLQEYFDNSHFQFKYCPYGDTLDNEFTHDGREVYFQNIPPVFLRNALVLLDADNGLAPRTAGPRNFHKYVKYEEVKSVYDRMNAKSILGLYQHLPHFHRKAFLYSTHTKLRELLKCRLPCSLSDGSVAFILIAKDKKRQKELRIALSDYMRTNLRLFD